MRVIAYGIPADYTDVYLRIGEGTTIQSVRMFANTVIRLYGPLYLRSPNEERATSVHEAPALRGSGEGSDHLGSLYAA
jgi:hypothetical protein